MKLKIEKELDSLLEGNYLINNSDKVKFIGNVLKIFENQNKELIERGDRYRENMLSEIKKLEKERSIRIDLESKNKELIEEKKTMLIDFCKSRMNERQWSVSSGYEIRAVKYYLNQLKTNRNES